MDECIYFTIRSKGKGKTKAWVFKKECPECKKTFEYYPEDPNPIGEEGWCHDCLFGVCDYDE